MQHRVEHAARWASSRTEILRSATSRGRNRLTLVALRTCGHDGRDVEKRTTPSAVGLADLVLMLFGRDFDGHAPSPEARHLHLSWTQLGGSWERWRAVLELRLRTPLEEDARLVRVGRELGSSDIELLASALALRVEHELLAARCLAFLQAPVGGSRPTLGLLEGALRPLANGAGPIAYGLFAGVAVETGLIRLLDPQRPLVERSLHVPEHLVLALSGRRGVRDGYRRLDADELVSLPPSIQADAERHARGLALAGTTHGLVLRSGSPREARSAACAIARAAGFEALFIETDDVRGLTPWLRAERLLPVFAKQLGPSERFVVPKLPRYDGPILVVTGRDGGVELAAGSTASWTIPIPPSGERSELWRRALPEYHAPEALGTRYRHGTARIAELARVARQLASGEGDRDGAGKLELQHVLDAARQSSSSGIEALAEPVLARVPLDALVLGDRLRSELELLLARCRRREDLDAGLGPSATTRYRPGVRALFVGASGTGKTLAASWLAGQLGLPLYRVDLASVMSKYIGETEKNLAQMLALAEHADVAMLFDEADSLFGKRTEVKQSNDRFANAQTNYLLQRMESYDGIVFLTSNSRSRFDAAFTRRLDFVIEFNAPSPEERRALWTSHLGRHHGIEARQLNQLAATTDLAGGHIRNVVLSAAVLAKNANRNINWQDILEGLTIEYRKLGRQPPAGLERAR